MNTKTPPVDAKPFIWLAAAAAYALSGPVQAEGREVTVKISVSTTGLDLSEPSGARALYGRLREAARTVCGSGNRVGLQPATDFSDCYEKALGDAVRSVNRPELNMIYLATHTLLDAEIHGIDVPARVAAK